MPPSKLDAIYRSLLLTKFFTRVKFRSNSKNFLDFTENIFFTFNSTGLGRTEKSPKVSKKCGVREFYGCFSTIAQ